MTLNATEAARLKELQAKSNCTEAEKQEQARLVEKQNKS